MLTDPAFELCNLIVEAHCEPGVLQKHERDGWTNAVYQSSSQKNFGTIFLKRKKKVTQSQQN